MDLEVFETGWSVLFQEPEINAGEPGQIVPVQFDGLPKLELHVPDIQAKQVFLFAHHVWKASVLVSKQLLEGRWHIKDKQCLELGAGTGLVSIVMCHLGARVVSSDYPSPEILKSLELNLKRNTKSDFQVIGHIWGSQTLVDYGKQFDYIFIADTVWMSDQHDNLLRDLSLLLKPDGIVGGSCGLHTGLEVVQVFFEKAKKHGFNTNILANYQIPVGAGLCEALEWQQIDQVSDFPEDRKKYQILFELTKM
ncbi:hypothetical protein EDD86DRAFT_212305 [Gorgonomyces haynaldii]|nr:hypothetical protein EDD86DRAFT_212305 [Gorgonomyces haynaldii]